MRESATSRSKGGPRILIIDDDRDVGESLRLTLQKWCSVVDVHNDPMQTVVEFKAGAYDLVILDYALPKMNGFELYKIIKGIDPDVKICLTTACEIMASETSRREFEQLQPPLDDEYILKKPFERKELFSKLSQILGGKIIAVVSSEIQHSLEHSA